MEIRKEAYFQVVKIISIKKNVELLRAIAQSVQLKYFQIMASFEPNHSVLMWILYKQLKIYQQENWEEGVQNGSK